MSRGKIFGVNDLEELIDSNPTIKNGCLVDTNILISASLPIDPKNEEAEELISQFAKLKIPLYTNVNIRSEFLEIQRRLLIPEGLIEFYEELDSKGDDILSAKLKSVQTSYRKSIGEGKVYKFNDDRIKEFRALFSTRPVGEKNGWEYFCERYLLDQISKVWDEVVELCGINFIQIRDGEQHPLLKSKVSWTGVTDLMGKFGIGSADAMILNLLLCSNVDFVATADGDVQFVRGFLSERQKLLLTI